MTDTITKRDFFLRGLMEGQRDLQKTWVDQLFTLVEGVPEPSRDFDTIRREDGYYTKLPESEELVYIEGSKGDHPLLRWLEPIELQPGDLPNYQGTEPITTTYGNVFVNHLVLVIPFGAKVPFQSGVFNIKKVEAMVEEQLVDNPPELLDDSGAFPTLEENPIEAPPGQIFVRDYIRYCDNILSLVGYNSTHVQSITPKSLTGHPERNKRRAALMEQYKDRLTDPAIIARIGDELEALDREWLAGDASLKFYSSDPNKYFGKVRKRLYSMFGGEAPFSDGVVMTLIERSLEEGIDPEDLPLMINSLREGTFNRGAQTQLGGESTKTIYRMVGTSRIVGEDCGVTYGVPFNFTAGNHQDFVKYNAVVDGEPVLLTEAITRGLIGQQVEVFAPLTCRAGKDDGGRNVCEKCAGVDLSEIKDGIPAAAAQIGGRFLSAFLAAMHGKTLSTKKMDLSIRIR